MSALIINSSLLDTEAGIKCSTKRMKRFSPSGQYYPDPSKPPEAEGENINGSKKVKTAQSFESLFDSETLCDVVLDVNDGQFVFKGHKMILGMKSEILAAMLNRVSYNDFENNRPVICLHETTDCSLVFSRFLYFIYSGAVWLHRDYVLSLYKLAEKYAVKSLMQHCESYITQILQNVISDGESARGFPIEVVCDMYEGSTYSEDISDLCFNVLCAKFRDLVTSERWRHCNWQLVCDLLKSDACNAEENVILTSATDWMKKNSLSDKNLIEDILINIRYPLLHRKVLYHLQKNAVFKNFPQVQALVENAVKYHCFKDLPEAKDDFVGIQFKRRVYRPRPSSADSVRSRDIEDSTRQTTSSHSLQSHSVLVQNEQQANSVTEQIYSNFLQAAGQQPFGSTFGVNSTIGQNVVSEPTVHNSGHTSRVHNVSAASFVQNAGVQTGDRSS
ncbi:hypothetical protein FSP39_006864 [Pinctada imbricata]|uniref:BTB domain-containing protein n=1 Tax=Pinctada imbricata TaxID=66713 RepID=A0AA88XSU2_PINIB|nr:hypothetical protein FSP39_006864 [Pinctada imbricata]